MNYSIRENKIWSRWCVFWHSNTDSVLVDNNVDTFWIYINEIKLNLQPPFIMTFPHLKSKSKRNKYKIIYLLVISVTDDCLAFSVLHSFVNTQFHRSTSSTRKTILKSLTILSKSINYPFMIRLVFDLITSFLQVHSGGGEKLN